MPQPTKEEQVARAASAALRDIATAQGNEVRSVPYGGTRDYQLDVKEMQIGTALRQAMEEGAKGKLKTEADVTARVQQLLEDPKILASGKSGFNALQSKLPDGNPKDGIIDIDEAARLKLEAIKKKLPELATMQNADELKDLRPSEQLARLARPAHGVKK